MVKWSSACQKSYKTSLICHCSRFSNLFLSIPTHQIKQSKMKTNQQDYTSVYLESIDTEHDHRSSSEPIIPPTSAKIKPSNYSSATSSYSTEGEAQQIEYSNREDDEEEKEVKPTMMERFKVFLSYARPMFIMLFFDVGLPLAVYYILKIWLSVLIALILSGIPPLLRVFYVFWKKRHIDILGCVFVFSFILSAVLSVISGKLRIYVLDQRVAVALTHFYRRCTIDLIA